MSKSIIESKNFIPSVMRQSRDIQAFCKIFDLLINNYKTKIDYWISMIDFDSCPDKYLPLLASYVGYKYDYTETPDTNRLIIKHYPEMIRNRGSKIGISLATAFSEADDVLRRGVQSISDLINNLGFINIDFADVTSILNIEMSNKEGRIKIYIYFPANLTKVRDLLEIVRPAGCGMELVPAEIIQTVDAIKIHTYAHATKYPYELTRYSVDEKDKIGFAEVTNQDRN